MVKAFRSIMILMAIFLLVIDLSECFFGGGHGKRGVHKIFKKVGLLCNHKNFHLG